MRTALPASQADQHLKRAGRSKARHQGSRRGHLARQVHALRSRILRPGAENPATSRQPVRHDVVTHVLGTTCHLCVRAGQLKSLERAKGFEPSTPTLAKKAEPSDFNSIAVHMHSLARTSAKD